MGRAEAADERMERRIRTPSRLDTSTRKPSSMDLGVFGKVLCVSACVLVMVRQSILLWNRGPIPLHAREAAGLPLLRVNMAKHGPRAASAGSCHGLVRSHRRDRRDRKWSSDSGSGRVMPGGATPRGCRVLPQPADRPRTPSVSCRPRMDKRAPRRRQNVGIGRAARNRRSASLDERAPVGHSVRRG